MNKVTQNPNETSNPSLGLYALSMVIIPELCPQELQQHIGSLIGLVIAGSGVLGPILGGFLTEFASWRWVFWIK
ncbi:MAG: MFS transporter [Acidobacteria bacterium]|nr:MFS transporter [Acidobacteriota bacterium]